MKKPASLITCAHCELDFAAGPACTHCGASQMHRYSDADRTLAAKWTRHPEAMAHLQKIGAPQ